MFQAIDSPDKSDSEGQDGREEEHVDVENMEHRYSQHARWRSEPETGWWQMTVAGQRKTRRGHQGQSKEAEEERKEKLLGRGGTWPVTEPMHSSSWWYLCRSSPSRAMARSIRQSRGHPRLATSHLTPVKADRPTWEPNGHLANGTCSVTVG